MRKSVLAFGLFFFLVGLALVLTAQKVYAMPAAPGNTHITQPDGTQFMAQTWGDEFASGVETLEGYSIHLQADGWWIYTLPTQSSGNASLNNLEGLRVTVNSTPPVEINLERNLILNNTNYLENPLETGGLILSPTGAEVATLSSNTPSAITSATTNTGTQPVLVILGYFDDMPPKTNPAEFEGRFFADSKSVKNYYSQASYGLLALTPIAENFGTFNDGIVGWINLGKTHPNPRNQDWTAALTIATSALNAADPYVNFSSFDKDGNKALSASELHIVVIVAGYEASYDGGAAGPSVWGHKWSLSTPVIADGIAVGSASVKGSYTMFGEMMSDHPSTMGIIVHEMGHDLGWPDLYGTGSAGLGTWDIMSFGGWNTVPGDTYLGQTPPLPNAYLRKIQSWIDPNNPAQLVPALEYKNTPINLSISTTNPFALILPVDSDPSPLVGEFFIVEHREKTGYDASLPSSGALVWRINESVLSNNNPQNPRVKLIQADGADHLLTTANYGDSGDAFNAASINTRFGVGTPLSSAYANGNPSNVLLVFCGGSLSGFAPMMGPQSIGVTPTLFSDLSFTPADHAYSIFLPLTCR
jgi:M6 family metalloprotease-like protein